MSNATDIRVCHIVVAAGSGSRYGAPLPKQFCDMGGRPLLMTTLGRLRRCGGGIVVVLSPAMRGMWAEMCAAHGFSSPATVAGGATRWASVRAALAHPLALGADIISVHDGARPNIDPVLVRRVTDVRRHGNVPAVAVTDSLRRLCGDGSSEAVDRSLYRAVQTPQAFRADLLRRAYEMPWRPEFTDDASVMEAAGFAEIDLVEGSDANIKVTRPGDILLAQTLMPLQ